MLKRTLCVMLAFFVTQAGLFAKEKEEIYKVDAPNAKSPYYLTVEKLDEALGVDKDTEKAKDYVRVIYFHRVPGCATCQMMSKYIFETVQKSFSGELKNKKVILRYYNFEDPKNEKLVKTFKVKSPSMFVIQGTGGKDVKAKNADQIWPLASDKKKFMEYVEKEIRDYFPKQEEAK